MKSAELPKNESARLQALAELDILDTSPEEVFDNITSLAADIFEVPICLVSLIDESRQWFKSRYGLDACETSRDVAFCAHAILSSDVFVIEDSRKDERFADNPLVTGQPEVIFYAGIPLSLGADIRIGTLCLIDNKPREFCESDKEKLRKLGKQVEKSIESRKQAFDRSYYTQMLEQLFHLNDSTTDDLNDTIKKYLKVGANVLGFENGILSNIKDGTYIVESAISPEDAIPIGATFALEDTYCEMVMNTGATVNFQEAGADPAVSAHPCYQNMKLESYIGTPVKVGGEIFGTLNFSSLDVRKRKYLPFEVHFIELIADSLGRKITLQESQADQQRLLSILDNTTDFVGQATVDKEVRFLNKAFRKHVGADKMDKLDISKFHDAEAMKLIEAEVMPTTIEQGVWKGNTTLRRMDGENTPVSTVHLAHKNSKGEPTHFSVIFRDITEDQNLQNKLQQANEELEQFAYIASHDLQAPLRHVRAFAGILREEIDSSALNEDADKALNNIETATNKMKSLITDLLNYSRAGVKKIDFEDYDLNKVINHILNILKTDIKECGAEIEIANLPTIACDSSKMEQLFSNLISNAMKYVPKGQSPRVSLTLDENSSSWTFCVSDNGIGIPADKLDKVFEVFQRLHSGADYPGSGIGLAICKKIATLHQGRIWIESEVGIGTKFFVELPKRLTSSAAE